MDEPAEQVTTFDVASWIAVDRWPWRLETETTVRPGRVVMLDIGAKCLFQLTMREDEQVVEAFGSYRLDSALGVRVRFGN